MKSKTVKYLVDRLMSDGKWRSVHQIVSDIIDLPLIKQGRGETESKVRNGRAQIPTRAQVPSYMRGNKKYEMRKDEKVKKWRMKENI